MKKLFLSSMLVLTAGCASTGPESIATNDPRSCAKNFTHEGSLMTGKVFKTNDTIQGVSKKSVFTKVSKHIAMDGWHITNSDSELGMINASQTVSFGKGKTAPLNISIDEFDAGVKVSISFSTSMGVHSPAEAVMESFCEIVGSAT